MIIINICLVFIDVGDKNEMSAKNRLFLSTKFLSRECWVQVYLINFPNPTSKMTSTDVISLIFDHYVIAKNYYVITIYFNM